tara:strand:+ start:2527 stop:2814 length:288 start_codon:yes stop_codon:yes gene_type:complete
MPLTGNFPGLQHRDKSMAKKHVYPDSPAFKDIHVTFHREEGSLGSWAGDEQPTHVVARVENPGGDVVETVGAGYTCGHALVNLARQLEASDTLEG